ncbi:MAG TPA: tetratricopeptide repeat protein [Gemmataceae bacterium]|nr:tetratricopeptide repeat protein [Gemmataceae bacterium]
MSLAQMPCPACNVVLRVAASTPANALIRCPKCGERFRLPEPAKDNEQGIVTAEMKSATPAPLPLAILVEDNAALVQKIRRSTPPSRTSLWVVLGSLTAGCSLIVLAGGIAVGVWLARAIAPTQAKFIPPTAKGPGRLPFGPPNHPPAVQDRSAVGWFTKGTLLMRQGDFDGAIDAFTRAIELDPRFASAYCNRGLARIDKGDFDGAIADSSKAIELNPKDPFPFINRANARILKGVDPDASIADATRALELRPGIPAALLNLGMARSQKGDYDGAIAEFDKAIAILPTFKKAYGQRGQTWMQKKKWAKAESDFTRALSSLNPAHPSIYQNRGICRMEKGNLEGALADFDAALRRGAGKVGLYYRRSQVLFLSGDPKAAQADLDKALALEPTLVPLHSFRAKILICEGDGNGALAAAEKLISLHPTSADALNCLAFVHAWRGENHKALTDYAASLKLDPKPIVTRLLRGWLYLCTGETNQAAEDAVAGLKLAALQDNQAPYLAILAHCAQRRQHPEQARRTADEMSKEVKQNWPGPVLRYVHEDISAEELLRTAGDLDQRTEAHAYIGVVLWLSGAADKARQHLEWVRDNGNPDFVEFDVALLLLRRLELKQMPKP